MKLQLYLWSLSRDRYLERHDFYVAQIRERFFSQFHDLESEADRFEESEFKRLASLPGDENSDMGDVAESARDQAIGLYTMLSDLKKQMLLGGLAGLYHQWDKDLRELLESELRRYLKPESVIKETWQPDLGGIFKILKLFGWDCAAEPFYSKVEACRLVVNVYKHGKGRSLNELAETYPEYLPDPIPRTSALFMGRDYIDHEWLSVTEEQFDAIAQALREFWERFPERSFYDAV